MTPICGWCDQAARYKVTGTGVHHTCDQHYQHAARAAGIPRTTTAVQQVDTQRGGQGVLFDTGEAS